MSGASATCRIRSDCVRSGIIPGVPFVIDGNNVIGVASGWAIGSGSSRRRLLDEVVAFAETTPERVTIVFDGAPEDRIPDGACHRGVLVRYPKRGSNADRVIAALVAASSDRRHITVVTSDRQLAAECRSKGAKILPADEFRRLSARRRRVEPPQSDPGEAERPATGPVDDWFAWFGISSEPEPAPDRRPARSTVGRRAPRRSRRRR